MQLRKALSEQQIHKILTIYALDLLVNPMILNYLSVVSKQKHWLIQALFNSYAPKPDLHDMSELNVQSVNGCLLPYSGYVELEICVPCFSNSFCAIPALVVPQTNNKKIVTVIVGTNFIRICRNTYEQILDEDVPDEWGAPFNSLKIKC